MKYYLLLVKKKIFYKLIKIYVDIEMIVCLIINIKKIKERLIMENLLKMT